jgi:hypothetical protein
MNVYAVLRSALPLASIIALFLAPVAVAGPIGAGTYTIVGTLDTDDGPLNPTGIAGTLVWDGTQVVPDGFTGTAISLLGTAESWTGPNWLGRIFDAGLLEYASLSYAGHHELQLHFDTMRWSVGVLGNADFVAYAGDFDLNTPGGPSVPEPGAFALLGAGLCALVFGRRLGLR